MNNKEIIEIVNNCFENLSNNKHQDFVIENNDFTLSQYRNGIYLYCDRGCTSLFACENTNISNDDTFKSIKEIVIDRIIDFMNGKIHCSDCGAIFDYDEVKHYRRSYFAGVYCQHCWDSKWKAIEAQETYD